MTATTKEQKKRRIIALLKADIEATYQMANKKTTHRYNENTKQILNEIIRGKENLETKKRIQTLMREMKN